MESAAFRHGSGGLSYWLIEAEGEIRPNTPVKTQAARFWCQRMSTTKFGAWRYVLLQQRSLERALAAGASRLSDLLPSP